MIQDVSYQKSLTSFLRENLSLLTERIVQTNSHIGEHYVTYTWDEFRRMFTSAAGGGLITAGTVYLKLTIGKIGLAGLMKGVVDGLNYAGSFLLIYTWGMTLATKQPSATAPFIAEALRKSTREARRSLVALLRTQFIAVLGNLSAAFPVAFTISAIALYFGRPVMSIVKAMETYNSTHILGPSVIYAAFTGCLLFLSSIIAGWAENWIIVNNYAKRICYNVRLRNWFGVRRIEKLSQFIHENANALAANISLGFMLGLAPQIMKFIGLGLDVRHVTLATASFAATLPMMLGMGIEIKSLVMVVSGIVLIGLLNISVSFLLAFLLASASSRVRFRSFLRLLRSSLRLLLTQPWLLFVPEKANQNTSPDEVPTNSSK